MSLLTASYGNGVQSTVSLGGVAVCSTAPTVAAVSLATPPQLSRPGSINISCVIPERGVPEGAASLSPPMAGAPVSSAASHLLVMSGSYVDPNAGGIVPTSTNAPNTVYYAMNV